MSAHEKASALRARKQTGPPIAALTAWDYPTARLLDEAGTDLILVGDSLGMVVLGFPDTTHVTLEHMLHHTAAAARGNKNALLVADFAIHSYDSAAQAVENARSLVAAGAEAVKLEGGVRQAEKVQAILDDGIEVLGHLGMLPQRVKEEGGYKKKGKSDNEIAWLEQGALALEDSPLSRIDIFFGHHRLRFPLDEGSASSGSGPSGSPCVMQSAPGAPMQNTSAPMQNTMAGENLGFNFILGSRERCLKAWKLPRSRGLDSAEEPANAREEH